MNFKFVLGVENLQKLRFEKKKNDFLMFFIVFKEFLDACESCASALRASPR